MARLIHHVGMWVMLIFAVVHVYFVLLSSVIEHIGTFDSIFSGYKFLPRAKSRPLVSSETRAVRSRKGRSAFSSSGLATFCSATTGLGAAAVARLERDYRIPPGVRLADGGTLGLSLLGLLADSDHVILVDAVRADGPPGTLVRLDGEDVMDAVRDRLSPHQVGVADLLDAARLIDCYPAIGDAAWASCRIPLIWRSPDRSLSTTGLMSLSRQLSARCKALATRWSGNRKLPAGIALFTVSLVISGCEREAAPPRRPDCWLRARRSKPARSIYAANCAICHGVNGDGRGQRREGMNPPPANLSLAAMVGDGEGRPDISRHSQWGAPDRDATLADAQRSANLATGRLHHFAQVGVASRPNYRLADSGVWPAT